MVERQEPVKISSPEASTSNTNNSYRCFTKGLGWPLPRKIGSGGVVAHVPVILHKYPRSYGSVPNPKESQPKEGLTHSPNGGQQYDNALHQSFRLQITSNHSCDPGNPQTGPQTGVASFSSTHRGCSERKSRRSLQVCTPGIGVDARPDIISNHPIDGPQNANRLIRNSGEPSAPTLRSPQHRPKGSGSGRNVLGLEPVGGNIPIPPNESHAEGIG